MCLKGCFPDALHIFYKEIGIPNLLVVDTLEGKYTNRLRCSSTKLSLSSVDLKIQLNNSELYIVLFREVKSRYT